MPVELRLRFHRVTLVENEPDEMLLVTAQSRLIIRELSPGLREAFRLLMTGVNEATLRQQVASEHFRYALRLQRYIEHFIESGLIARSLYADGEALATLVPTAPGSPVRITKVGSDAVLSRFAFCRRVGKEMVLECPLAHAYILLHEWRAVAMVGALTDPATSTLVIGADVSRAFYELLAAANMLSNDVGLSQEDSDEALRQWTFHDLVFQASYREGRRSDLAARPMQDYGQLPPVIKPRMSSDLVKLHRPDMEQLKQDDMPFTSVLEQRRSIRDYGQNVITCAQLGEFLYRSAHIEDTLRGELYEASKRVTPGAGAAHELEIYVVVRQCQDLSGGLYHYSPQDHHLERLTAASQSVQQLLQNAAALTGEPTTSPQILLIIAARFQRILWKYESTALSLILKDVGALFQTMYLVATAMHLAPCAIGQGNSDLFSTVIGTNYYEETSVGEFILGGRE